MKKSTSAVLFGLALASSAASAVNFDVTITNITRGIVFTPFLVATHKPAVSLFTLGSPASTELSALAEGGDTAPLKALLKGNPKVADVQTSSGLLEPGKSVTVRVTGAWDSRFSVAAMLLPTNDGFAALDGVYGPFLGQTVSYEAPAYDAGSEPNDELCANIPGPMCHGQGGSPTESGEGFVHIHAGIHGIGDLPASDYDWRNPVVTVSIKRAP